MYKILLATDGSENSFKAVEKAIEIAKPLEADVTVLSVAQDVPVFKGQEGLSYDQAVALQKNMVEGLGKAAQEVLDNTKKVFADHGMEVRTMLKKGQPANAICDEATSGDYNMVILGSRGLGGLKEFILGSVSNKVAHCAHTSVLIVK